MKCPNCNFEVADNTKFCPECGTKMPEITAEATVSSEAPDETSNVSSNVETNEQKKAKKKKAKKKKIKKIIIISVSSLLACGIILCLLNPFCMFGHHSSHLEGKDATCTEAGDEKSICDKCGKVDLDFSRKALGHKFGYQKLECDRCGEKRSCDLAEIEHKYEKAMCGKENTCVNCGHTKKLQHTLKSSSDMCCMYCGQDKFSVKLPTEPITVDEYDHSNNIEQSCVVTQIKVAPYLSDAIQITYTVKRTYHEDGNNLSASTKIGWKLYASDGTVVDGGTDYSDGNIKVGEKSKGTINVYNLNLWSVYRLEILNVS